MTRVAASPWTTRAMPIVTGYTSSDQATFPVTVGPDLTHNGGQDVFVAKIAADVGLLGSVAVGGAPVVGAKVLLKNLATAAKSKSTTDAAGGYQFEPVASGSYSIGIGTFTVGATNTISGNLRVKLAPSVGTKVKLKNKTTGARQQDDHRCERQLLLRRRGTREIQAHHLAGAGAVSN